jgi:hypothetical protein
MATTQHPNPQTVTRDVEPGTKAARLAADGRRHERMVAEPSGSVLSVWA